MKGSITVDFIFGVVIVAAISSILLSFCLTMAVVEIGQYISFASARTYFGAHKSERDQMDRAEAKFKNIMTNRALAKILKGDWYNLKYLNTGDYRSLYSAGGLEHDNDTFFGNRLELEVKVLELVPIFKSIVGEAEQNNYRTNLGSYLGREPNFDECMNFMRDRWKNFISSNPLTGASSGQNSDAYAIIVDNGC
jgi:hypothetical protein